MSPRAPRCLALLIAASTFVAQAPTASAAEPIASSCDATKPSPFWSQMKALCPQLEGASRNMVAPESQPSLEQVMSFCHGLRSSHTPLPPGFAAGSESARLGELARLARAAGIVLPAVEPPRLDPIPWLDIALDSVRLPPELETGAAGAALIHAFVEAACTPGTRRWLDSTCTNWKDARGGGFRELRRRLTRDLLGLGSRLGRQSSSTAAHEALELSAATAFLDAMARSLHPREVALALARASQPRLGTPNSLCTIPPTPSHPLELAGLLLQRFALDGPGYRHRPKRYAVEVARRVLVEAGAMGAHDELSLLRRNAAIALNTALRQFDDISRQHLGSWSEPALLGLLGALQRATRHALSLALDHHMVLPVESLTVVTALATGKGLAAYDALATLLRSAAPIPEDVERALDLGLRLSAARDEAEARRILRSAALGLGPWSDNLLLDVNLGYPSFGGDNLRLAGDLTLGYSGDYFGVAARGMIGVYDLTTSQILSDTYHSQGSAELWGTMRFEHHILVELRALGQLALHDTQSIDLTGAGTNVLSEETSVLGRGMLLGSLRLQPRAHWALGLWIGAGYQSEIYDALRARPGGGVEIDAEDRSSLLLEGRFRYQHAIVVDYLVARARLDLQSYSITRDLQSLSVTGTGVAVSAAAVESVQMEGSARLFLDLEALRLAGIVPSAHLGLDWIHRSTPGYDALTTWIPILGAGLRSVAF